MRISLVIMLVAWFLFSVNLNGQGLPLDFQNLTVEDGLPQNSITSLVMDDRGFIWIGTQDGLARYDGYEFKVFRHERNNPNSLSHNFIWDISKDSEGVLWITTLGNGLTRFDPVREQFSDLQKIHWKNSSPIRLRSDTVNFSVKNQIGCSEFR